MIAYLHYFAVCLLLTYGVTGSTLLMPVRMWFSRRGEWATAFVYCPYCVGFWAALGAAVIYPTELFWMRFLYGPAMYIALLLIIKVFRDDFLVSPTADEELQARAIAITVTVKNEGTIYRKPIDEHSTTKEESEANAG